MMLITNWVQIPEKAINKPRQIEKDGVKFTQSISPWDLPQQFRFISSDKELIIELRYLSDSEPTKHTQLKNGLFVEVGKSSDRIYRISIPYSKFEDSTSSVSPSEADTFTEALIKLKNTLEDYVNYPNENNKNAVTKTENWWEHLPNKTELLAAVM